MSASTVRRILAADTIKPWQYRSWLFIRDPDQVQDRLTAFEQRYNATAQPFKWKFTPADLEDLLARIERQEQKERNQQHAACGPGSGRGAAGASLLNASGCIQRRVARGLAVELAASPEWRWRMTAPRLS